MALVSGEWVWRLEPFAGSALEWSFASVAASSPLTSRNSHLTSEILVAIASGSEGVKTSDTRNNTCEGLLVGHVAQGIGGHGVAGRQGLGREWTEVELRELSATSMREDLHR